MAGRRQIVYDSRLPVGEHTNMSDPTHPRNIVMLAASTEAQAAADQRYDINPPPRVEGFLSNIPTQSIMRLPFLVNVFIVCILLVAVFQIKQNIIKTVLAVGIIVFLHSVINQFNTRCAATSTSV